MSQEERIHLVSNQRVFMDKEINGNLILDIGGGGEGVIGLCYGNKVISIDPSKEELEEAPSGPLKIVMDAKKLLFLDKTFDTVTSFFSLMYIRGSDHKRVLSEVYRVLKNGGEFILLDAIIPKYDGGKKDIFVVKLEIDTSRKIIETGYGVLWKDKKQDLNYFLELGEEIGFKVIKESKEDQIFKIIFKK